MNSGSIGEVEPSSGMNPTDSEAETESSSVKIDCLQEVDLAVEKLFYDQAVARCQDPTYAKGMRLVGSLYIELITASSLHDVLCLCAITGGLAIYEADSLVDLSGLEQLESIGGGFHIRYNDMLNSLQGLSA